MSDEKTLDFYKEVSKDLNDLVKEITQGGVHIPILSTIYAFAGLAISKWEKSKFEEFLNQIRIPLAFDNIGQVGVYIAQNQHHRWMLDGLQQGWRLGIETMDDTARKCAYNMVAEYMAQEHAADRAFRQLAGLFKASDEKILRMLLRLAEALGEFKGACLIGTSQSQGGLYFGYAIFEQGNRFLELEPVEEEYSVETACEVAVLANLGVFWNDPSIEDSRPGFEIIHRICQVEPHHHLLWKKLHGYLKPVLGAEKI